MSVADVSRRTGLASCTIYSIRKKAKATLTYKEIGEWKAYLANAQAAGVSFPGMIQMNSRLESLLMVAQAGLKNHINEKTTLAEHELFLHGIDEQESLLRRIDDLKIDLETMLNRIAYIRNEGNA